MISPAINVSIEQRIIAWLAAQDTAAYLVGGWVRDRLLGRPNYDLDVTVAGDGLRLARRLADDFEGSYYPLDEERGTGRAILEDREEHRLIIDIASFRGLTPPESSSLGYRPAEAGPAELAADLADRDFTINALAVDVRAPEQIIDHHGGLADLEARLIRPVSDATIRNDPVRTLRAVRQAAQLGFALAPETKALIRRDGAAVAQVSGERVRDEVTRLLALPYAAPSLELLDDLGLLTVVLPELEPLRDLAQPPPHYLPALAHSLETVRALEHLLAILFSESQSPIRQSTNLPILGPVLPFADRLQEHLEQTMSDGRTRLVTLKLAALLHDVGKPAAETVDETGRIRFLGHHKAGTRLAVEALIRLRLSRVEVRLGETIVRHHMRPLQLAKQKRVSARAVYRFFRDTGDAGVEVLLHALADNRATYAPDAKDEQWPRLVDLVSRMLGDYWERQAQRVAPVPLIGGSDLLREFDLQPGPQIGELLEAVREAQVSGEVHTREEAMALVRDRLSG